MPSFVPVPPRRADPALTPGQPDDAVPLARPRAERPLVRFTDGSWRLCWIRAWQRTGNGWLVHLAWGEWGQIRDGWYAHDPRHVTPLGTPEQHADDA